MGTAVAMSDARATLAETFRWFSAACELLGSPLWSDVNRRLAADVEVGGPTWSLLEEFAEESTEAAYPLRALGGAHRLALSGDATALAAHLPSTGGDGDPDGAWTALLALFEAPPPALVDALSRPPQTNEVGRAASLIGGFLQIAAETRLPLRVFEIGASAGLNLRFDRFRYEQGSEGFGPRDAPVQFSGLWADARPHFDAPLEVVARAGCDLDPLDPTTPDGRLTLLSYVWPDQTERFARTAGAIDIAGQVPVSLDREDAPVWLRRRLRERPPGTTTVVYHSIMWQYLDEVTRKDVVGALEQAGAEATDDAVLAWLRLEPADDYSCAELRLRTWPSGGNDRLLARGSFHLGPVAWLV
jgi:hypothetical protein